MAYYPDLSPYSYLPGNARPGELNVGWLDRQHPFPTGVIPGLAEKIFSLCRRPVNRTRGFHACEFCDAPRMGVEVEHAQVKLRLGSAEIRVQGRAEVQFACPDLIYHYIVGHAYQPPAEFVEAVLALDPVVV